ncbi:hypothetical protein [Bdellovibrio sp.]|uniref:hypothetical protein n=1 Tax=Bdellovibrio sp. TaxID=28201 RepID=UPI0039E35642
MKSGTYLFISLWFFLQAVAFESAIAQTHKGISFQGVIKLPSGEYPSRAGVTVNASILSPNNCVLREEQFVGVNISNGYINLAVGTGPAVGYDPGLSLKKIMDNSSIVTGLTCLNVDGSINGGTTVFDPSLTNGARKLRISLTIDSIPIVADFNMRSMAFAVNAESLDGKSKNEFIQTSSVLSQTRLEEFLTVMTSAAGGSIKWNGSNFVSYDPIGVDSIPDSAIVSLPYNKLTSIPTPISEFAGLSCANGKILKKVSGSWACADESGVGVESDPTVQTFAKNAPGSGLEVSGGNLQVKMSDVQTNASGSWGIDITGNAATATSATTATNFSGSLAGDVTGTQSATAVTKIRGNNVAAGVPTDGLLTWNSTLTRWEAVNPPTCSDAQSLKWSAVADSFSCVSISITKSQVSDFPTLATSATTDTTNATNITSGTLDANRLPASITNALWTTSGANIYRSSGNVGIGVSTPSVALDVNGTIRATEICDESGANCKDISTGWSSGGSAGTALGVLGFSKRSDTGTLTFNGTIPADNTIPQVTEGDEVLSVTVTVPDSADYLYFKIEHLNYGETSNHSDVFTIGLFRDGQVGTDALAVHAEEGDYSNNEGSINTTLRIPAPVAGTYTYRVRAGFNGGSFNLNRGYNNYTLLSGNMNQASITVLADGAGSAPAFNYWTSSGGGISYNGNVGVGTASPDTKLHVAGAVKIADGTQGADKLLVSDANGSATWAAFPKFRSVSSGNQSVPLSIWTKITLSSETFDTANAFDSTNSRFFPSIPGYYRLTGTAQNVVACSGSFTTLLALYKNGSNYEYSEIQTFAGRGSRKQVSDLIYLNGTTDYVELYVYHDCVDGSRTFQGTLGGEKAP